VLRGLVISAREILHFGKSGLGFLGHSFFCFQPRRKATHMCERRENNARVREGTHTCGRNRSVQPHVWYGTCPYSHTCDNPYNRKQAARVREQNRCTCGFSGKYNRLYRLMSTVRSLYDVSTGRTVCSTDL
jgi:hypothetical protein